MSDLTNLAGVNLPIGGAAARQATAAQGHATVKPGVHESESKDFRTLLMDSLEKVNELQKQAGQGIEALQTGQTDNVAEVLVSVRKADVAFSLLMEIRNKLMDAYNEVRQMRV